MWPPEARKRGIRAVRLATRGVRHSGGMGKLPMGDMNSFWTSRMTRARVGEVIAAVFDRAPWRD